jgi:hypothetical protein
MSSGGHTEHGTLWMSSDGSPPTRHVVDAPSQVDGTPREMNLITWSGLWPGQNACIAHVPPATSRSDNDTPVRGQFPVRSFGHQMSAPLAVMLNSR